MDPWFNFSDVCADGVWVLWGKKLGTVSGKLNQ